MIAWVQNLPLAAVRMSRPNVCWTKNLVENVSTNNEKPLSPTTKTQMILSRTTQEGLQPSLARIEQ